MLVKEQLGDNKLLAGSFQDCMYTLFQFGVPACLKQYYPTSHALVWSGLFCYF